MIPLIARAQIHPTRTALVTNEGTFTYGDLLHRSRQIAIALLKHKQDLQEQRVAFLIPSSFAYVATQWGIWRAGGIAVPLCTAHPRPELEYAILHSGASILVVHPDFETILRLIAQDHDLPVILTSESFSNEGILPDIEVDRRALMLFTSGTTGKPKGVITTHRNIQAQVESLVAAWEWTEDDRILHVLPLHHIHGIINVLICALWAGAQCFMMPKFDPEAVWEHISESNLTLFMAVPTIYTKLIAAWKKAPCDRQQRWSATCVHLRLMVSGSAALPVQVLEQWRQISGHVLLERYGMTEIGMALSNPLHGQRQSGSVGKPLPQVNVRLVDEDRVIVPVGTPGEIQVQGPGVFLEYWQNAEETAKAFQEGWFCTGDFAVFEAGAYRILGRISVDIIKTGGYKVSALEIEEVLRTHPSIQDCAVVGVEDPEWGERVCAALVLPPKHTMTLGELRVWAKKKLAVYKVPVCIAITPELPRNAMGKVIKPRVVDLFAGSK